MASNKTTTRITITASIGVVFLLLFLIIGLHLRFQKKELPIAEAIDIRVSLPDFKPPKTAERERIELATSLVGWWTQHKEENKPYPYGFNCNSLGDCQRQDEAHRDNIPLLWARNEIFLKTYDPDQLSAMIDEIETLSYIMDTVEAQRISFPSQKVTTDRFNPLEEERDQVYVIGEYESLIWQNDYYHCLLIDQIITSNLYLPEKSVEYLARFCRDSINDAEIPVFFEESEHEAMLERIEQKMYSFIVPESSPYNWDYDPTTIQFREWNLSDYELEKNVFLLADYTAKDKYPLEYPRPVFDSIENYLDTALTSYYLRLERGDLDTIERYQLDSWLLLGIHLCQEKITDEKLPLPYFFEYLVGQLVFPSKRELEVKLYSTSDMFLIGDLCFLEKQIDKGYRIYPELYEIVLKYHQVQKERAPDDEFRPFYHPKVLHPSSTDYVVYNLRENALLSGCLINNE